jgi:large subunit ribosomal protein L15
MLLHQVKPDIRQKKKKRVGRGPSSGHGKTSTKGQKGATSRSGRHTYIGFSGNSMRLLRKLPKIGFNIYKKRVFQIVNLESLNRAIKKDISEINPKVLKDAGLIKSETKQVKILAEGEIKRPLIFQGCKFSASAIKKINESGGKIVN